MKTCRSWTRLAVKIRHRYQPATTCCWSTTLKQSKHHRRRTTTRTRLRSSWSVCTSVRSSFRNFRKRPCKDYPHGPLLLSLRGRLTMKLQGTLPVYRRPTRGYPTKATARNDRRECYDSAISLRRASRASSDIETLRRAASIRTCLWNSSSKRAVRQIRSALVSAFDICTSDAPHHYRSCYVASAKQRSTYLITR